MKTLFCVGASGMLALIWSVGGNASCGATFCSLATGWEGQSGWSEPGTRLDLRFEYVDQDQPRAGRKSVDVGEIPEDEDEIRTINRNLVVGLDYTINPRWGVSLQVPFVSRAHSHVHNESTGPVLESWDIERLGDLRLLARRQLYGDTAATGWSVVAGVKLPTGSFTETNADGDLAERSLQPGSGTTDAIVGLDYNAIIPVGGVPLHGFFDVRAQRALAERDDYRPGHQYSLDFGVAYAFDTRWSALLQVNAQLRGRDRGTDAEPEDTGASYLWLSPGASYALGKQHRLYGFVQLPLYQRVNGVQLTADAAFVIGLSRRF